MRAVRQNWIQPIFLALCLALNADALAQPAPLESAATLPPAGAQPVSPGGITLGAMVVYPGIDESYEQHDKPF